MHLLGLTPNQCGELEHIAARMREQNSKTRVYTGPDNGAQCDAEGPAAALSGVAHGMTRHGASPIDYSGDAVNESSPVAEPRRSFAPPRTIGWAIKQLHNGARVTRAGWNGKRQWLALQLPDGRSYMTLPYIFISTISGDRVPWLASQTDLLATDWQLA